jgi:hypothetical protein
MYLSILAPLQQSLIIRKQVLLFDFARPPQLSSAFQDRSSHSGACIFPNNLTSGNQFPENKSGGFGLRLW